MDLKTAVAALFAPARQPGRVGVEVELIPVTDTARPNPVDPVLLASGFDLGFARAAGPSFEPGGQLELSPPPQPTIAGLMHDLDRLLRRVTAIASQRGIRLEAVGLNPYHSCADVPLRLPTARYLALQEMFDEVGPDGRRMMRLTASLQVAIDLLPEPAGARAVAGRQPGRPGSGGRVRQLRLSRRPSSGHSWCPHPDLAER